MSTFKNFMNHSATNTGLDMLNGALITLLVACSFYGITFF